MENKCHEVVGVILRGLHASLQSFKLEGTFPESSMVHKLG